MFGVEIKPTALADISNFRSGATTFSFQFQTPHPSTKCVTYKGVFGVDNPLPTTLQVLGDYYECEDWNFYLTSGTQTYTFTKGMYIYWNGSRWIKDALLVELNTSTVSIPVEPSHAVGYEIDDDDANYLASIGAAAILAQQTAEQSAQDVLDLQSGDKEFTEILLSDGVGGEARLTYDGTDPILSYRGITGEVFKNLFLEVEPASGVTFTNGMNVMYAGSIGGSGRRLAKPTVLSELKANPNLYLGMITQVTTDGYGVVNWYGVVNSLNTSGLTLGADVYVGDGGAFTTIKPISPLPQIEIGLIERVNIANGAISLRPNVGRYLNGLHDVFTNSHTFVGGETIMFNITNGRYEIYDLAGNILRIDNDIAILQSTKVPKTTTIIGLDLQDNILIGEFRTALGNATQSVAGLLSAEDKTHLDGLVALLETSDGDTIVDTIGEILAIFQNYPEGADLVTVLQGKVDKVSGKELSTNDFTDLLKAKLDSLLDGTQYYDKTYIDSLKDQNGWQSQLLTLTPLTNGQTVSTATLLTFNSLRLQVKDTSTSFVDTDTVEVSLGVVTGNKIQLSDTTVYLEIGATNSTFTAPVGWELQIVGLKYTELKAVETTYDNTDSGRTATDVQEALDEAFSEIDTKEAITNKAIDFSVVNDTKYPTTKAVSERLLNLPIAKLNNHTLREVFDGGNLVSMTLSEWQTTFGTVITSTDDILRSTVSTPSLSNGIRTVNNVLILNNDYYLKLQFKPYRTHNMLLYIGNGFVNTNINATANIFNDISYQFNVTNDTEKRLIFNNNGNSLTDTVVGSFSEFKEIYFINRTSLGISALTVSQMNYWFGVYQALLVSDTNAIFSMFASKTLESWLTPTLTTATTTYLKYRKDNFGVVAIEGNITVGTAGTNLTLPTGYRPLFAYTVGNLTFNTNGTVVSSATGTQTLSIRFTGGA